MVTVLLILSSLSAEKGILEIQWPKVNLQQQKPSIPYPTLLKEGIKDTKLPVYLPKRLAYDKKMIVVADENFYTISFLLDGATVMVSGDRTFQEDFSKKSSDFQKMMKPSASVEFIEEEGIRSANFNRHGANYELSVECETPKEDKRCKKESFLRNLYNELIIVGGKK